MDANQRELITKLRALAARRGLTHEQLFRAYDGDGDGELRSIELVELLKDADVGSAWTRSIWASKILDQLDGDQTRTLSWPEVRAAIESGSPPAPAPAPQGATITRAEARAIAQRILEGSGNVDLSAFNNADLALIEQESIALGKQLDLPPAAPVPPIPYEPAASISLTNTGLAVTLLVASAFVALGLYSRRW